MAQEMTSTMSRRNFLKVSAGTAAALGAGALVYGGVEGNLFAFADANQNSQDEWVYSYCRNCISPYCGLKVHLRNGVAVGLEGDTEWPLSRGRLCPRGNGNLDALYNPHCVKAPMKRTNPEKSLTNDPGWVEITWDEAIQTVADRLNAVKADDVNKLIVARGFGAIWDDMPMFRPLFGVMFGTATATEINGPLCPFHYGPMVAMGSFTCAADLKHCNYLVTFGANYGGDFTRANAGADCLYTSTALLQHAFERGMQLFSVDPHAGGDTKSHGEWVPIIPGTDLPVVLAFAEVIMCEEKKWDKEFVEWRTNFPYLIDSDWNYIRDTETNKPMIYDTVLEKAVTFDDPELTSPALEGTFNVNGVNAQPAFAIIKNYVSTFTPEKAESISGVPAEKIRELALGLLEHAMIGSTIDINGTTFPYRPACVHYGRGATAHRGGVFFMYAVNIVNSLLGAIDVPGGMVNGSGVGDYQHPGEDGTLLPSTSTNSHCSEWVDSDFAYPTKSFDLTEYYPHRHSTPHVAWRAVVEGKGGSKYHMAQDAEVLWVWGANPFVNNIECSEAVEAWKKLWVIDIAYNFDETSQMSDILLAEPSPLERTAFASIVSMDLEGDHRICTGINFRTSIFGRDENGNGITLYNTMSGGHVIAEIVHTMDPIVMTAQMNGMFAGMAGIPSAQPWNETPVTTAMGPVPQTFEQMVQTLLQANYGTDKTLDDVRKNGSAFVVKPVDEEKSYNTYYYPGRSTRINVWDDHMRQTNIRLSAEFDKYGISAPGWDRDEYLSFFQPIPQWIEHPEHKALKGDYDLLVVNWKIAGRAQAMGVAESPMIRETQNFTDPNIDSVIINALTAAEKGIAEGDKVRVTSVNGKSLEGEAHLSHLIERHCLGFAGNYGHVAPMMSKWAQKGLNYNQLLDASDGLFDPVSGGMENTNAVKIEKL